MFEPQKNNKKPNPCVSVIVPTYRDSSKVLEALRSVLTQSHEDWEIIIIDDGSPETEQQRLSLDVLGLDDPRISVYLSRRNRGAARARNLGIRLAKGRFVAFLDADDIWMPTKLEKQVDAMNVTGAGLCCSSYRNVDEDTGKESIRVPSETPNYYDLMSDNSVGCSTVMLNKDVVGRVYFPDLRLRQDFALWLLLLRNGCPAIGLPEVLTIRRVRSGSISSNKIRAAYYTWKVFRDVEKMGFFGSAWHFFWYTVGGVVRRYIR